MQFVSVYNFVDVVVVFVLAFFVVFLLTLNRGNILSIRLLAAFLACLGLSYMDGVFLSFGFRFHYSYAHMVYLTMSFDYLVGPFLYLYVLSRTRPGFRLRWTHTVHFIVFILHFGFLFFRYHIKSLEEKRELLTTHQVFSYQEVYGLVVFSYIHYFIYLLLVVFTLAHYQRAIKQVFSDIHQANLRWLLIICAGLLLGGLMRFTNNLLWLEAPESSILRAIDFKLFAISAVFIFACTVLYKSLQAPGILRMRALPLDPKTGAIAAVGNNDMASVLPEPIAGEKGLPEKKRKAIKDDLLRYMELKKPYLNSGLTLYDLASEMHISSHHLSQVINTECCSNFYDFVNGYRLQACIAQLRDRNNCKYVSQIMYDCGFNSKSVFNTLFKRVMGTTPTAFRNQQRQETSVSTVDADGQQVGLSPD